MKTNASAKLRAIRSTRFGNEQGLSSKSLILVLAVVISLVAVPNSAAQTQFGSVVGTVTDPSGAPMASVPIQATNEASHLGFSTVTGGPGDFVIGGLIPGTYTLTAKKPGFKDSQIRGVIVSSGQSARADIQMEIGSAIEKLTVSANATPLNTESGTVTAAVPEHYIPLTGTILPPNQDIIDILLPYLPGQTFLGGRAISAYGSRSYDRKVTLDGSVFSNQNGGGPTLHMPRGTIDEIQAPSLNAEASSQTASTSEMITTRGTNDLHGSFWSEFQNGALNQLPWYSQPGTAKPGVPIVGFGFTLGGPVYIPKVYHGRNKTFFEVTYQRYHPNTSYVRVATLPTDPMRNGNLAGQGTITDPLIGQPFPGGVIPSSRLSPIAQNILNRFYPSIGSIPFAAPDASVFSIQVTPYWDLFTRFDEQFGSKDALSVTYLHNQTFSQIVPGATSGGTTGGPATTGLGFTDGHLNYLSAAENHIFSPSLLNELSLGARVGPYSAQTYSIEGASLLNSLGLPTTPGAPPGVTGLPTISITGMSGINAGGSQGQSESWIYTVRDDLAWTHGRYTTRVGVEFLRPSSTSVGFANLFGTYNFSGLFTSNPFADFLLGLPSSTSRQQPAARLSTVQHQIGFYVSETVRLTRKLTVTAGLRVENLAPPIEIHGRYYNFDITTGHLVVPDQSSISLLNPGLSPSVLASIVTAAEAGFPSKLVNGLWNYTPRIGFAYQVESNTVVRGGFGSYGTLLGYGAPTGGPFTPGVQNFTNSNICNGGTCAPAFTLANPFPSGAVNSVSGLSISGVAPNLREPVTYQWNLTAEHRLPGNMIVRAIYAGSQSAQLPYQRNANLPPASTIPFTSSRLLYPQWFSVAYTDSGGVSSYHSGTVEFERRWLNGVTFDGSYALAKCLSDDDESGLQSYGGVGMLGSTIENPYNLARDKGNCEATPRQSVRALFVADLPFGRNRKWLSNVHGISGGIVNSVLGGWTISGMFMARTGYYFTPYWTGFDAANTGQTLIRPNRVCSGNANPQTWDHTFDPTCFVKPTAGSYGNAGKGTINGLPIWDLDNGIYKYFSFAQSERVPKLRLGMTAINTLGHPGKDETGNTPFVINTPTTVARANDTLYINNATAGLGQWRHIYFEARLEW
jgi:hypothetical protein